MVKFWEVFWIPIQHTVSLWSNAVSFFEGDVRVVKLSEWLDWSSGLNNDKFVALPMIQRGSVWKPNQIIELWDSLLQGMPIGCLMVSELVPGTKVRLPGGIKSELVPAEGGLGLIDGQQRTLTLLAAWPVKVEMDRRIWVDFADEPLPGQLLRLRVTTANQPFGFRRDDPSKKLSLDDKRTAMKRYAAGMGDLMGNAMPDLPHLESTWPYAAKPVLPVDLEWLIESWRNVHGDESAWIRQVLGKIESVRQRVEVVFAQLQMSAGWPDKTVVEQRVRLMAEGLQRLFRMELPLIRVDARFFEIKDVSDSDPPLAMLFKRVGTGGTKLSDADYVYSIIKHIRPEVYDLVESLYDPTSGMRTIASLLTSTDLVMSAVRLAVADWEAMEKTFPDRESLGKSDFHRLLRNSGFLADKFLPLIDVGTSGQHSRISQYFTKLQQCLEYNSVTNPLGLPKHLLPYLGRPLVQVLLRLAQIGYLDDSHLETNRSELLRLVMFWLVNVSDSRKASELAYRVIRDEGKQDAQHDGEALCRKIYLRLVEEGCAIKLHAPSALEACPGLVWSANSTILRSHNRFCPAKEDEAALYHFYRNWWRPWTYHHPVLLWLQREYVTSQFSEDPLAGREEDTPYDFDHILPYNHWGDWRGQHTDPNRLPVFAEGELGVAGNGIGNVRVWGSSLNRSDGDTAPGIKLMLVDTASTDVSVTSAAELLRWSAIPDTDDSREAWLRASGLAAHERSWNPDRVQAFQRAIELRAFDLYCQYFNGLGYSGWIQ